MTKYYITSALCGLFIATGMIVAPIHAGQNSTAQAPDNTRVNKRDRDQSQPTADQGKNNMSDRQIMAHIRREVVKDKNLSSYGHNVKIISDHGKVTLRGPVHSEDEKRAIEEHARKYAREGSITNELTVKEDRK